MFRCLFPCFRLLIIRRARCLNFKWKAIINSGSNFDTFWEISGYFEITYKNIGKNCKYPISTENIEELNNKKHQNLLSSIIIAEKENICIERNIHSIQIKLKEKVKQI